MINTFFIFGAKYLYILIITIALFCFLKQPGNTKKQMIVFGTFALPLIYIIAKIAGFLFLSPRPFVVNGFTPLISHAADNGFPSDHVLLAAGISAVIYSGNRFVGWILWELTVLVGISRVYVGIHSPTDIVGSIIISIVVAGSIYVFIRKNSLHDSFGVQKRAYL